MRTLLLKPDGDALIVEHAAPLDLDALQGYVGGYIEIVQANGGKRTTTATNAYGVDENITIPPNATLILNEEGKLKGLPPNILATAAYGGHDLLVGTVVIPLDWEVE